MKPYFWKKTKNSQDDFQQGRRNVFSRFFNYGYRNWGLAKRLEHIKNRGKHGRGEGHKS